MNLTDIKELYRNKAAYADKEVTVGGWVRNNRDSKNFGFLVINDGTFFEPLQVVYSDKQATSIFIAPHLWRCLFLYAFVQSRILYMRSVHL